MPLNPNDYIVKARIALTSIGWSCDETFNENGEGHLVLTKDGERKAWGMFDQIFCWSEAYKTITGRSWLELTRK